MATERVCFDIEINNSKQVSGGYILTSKPMTITEVKRYLTNLGKEFLRNNESINSISYSAWEQDDECLLNVEDMLHVFCIVKRESKNKFSTIFY